MQIKQRGLYGFNWKESTDITQLFMASCTYTDWRQTDFLHDLHVTEPDQKSISCILLTLPYGTFNIFFSFKYPSIEVE